MTNKWGDIFNYSTIFVIMHIFNLLFPQLSASLDRFSREYIDNDALEIYIHYSVTCRSKRVHVYRNINLLHSMFL